jgi:hypothetical protein
MWIVTLQEAASRQGGGEGHYLRLPRSPVSSRRDGLAAGLLSADEVHQRAGMVAGFSYVLSDAAGHHPHTHCTAV